MIDNMHPIGDLRGLASRRSKEHEYKSVRHPLVAQEVSAGWSVVRRNKTTTRLKRPKTHDRALEDRVWTLMYRMGFAYLSGKGGADLGHNKPGAPGNQIDIVAIDEEIAFAVECKSKAKPGRLVDFSAVLAKHVGFRDRFSQALRVQFPSANKRPAIFAIWTADVILSENDRARAAEAGVHLLEGSDLGYYEDLVGQIGTAARYQFLADILQGRRIPGLELTVPAIRTRMGPGTAYTFSVPPEYLLKVAFVSHRARGKASDIDAYQRMLKRGRLKRIRKYITEGGIFPTNIVVNIAEQRWITFDRGKQETDQRIGSVFGWLHIRPSYRVAWIIDGQHRLFAYAGLPQAKTDLISVMAFVGLPASEQARLFVDINAEQRKVKQSLLQELYAELHWDADDPETRIQAILSKVVQSVDVDLDSPFKGRILKADDRRTPLRCISLTSLFRALERTTFFIAKTKKGTVVEFGPLWDGDNTGTLRRTCYVLEGYFGKIREEASHLWEMGAGEGGGLAMNDGVTVCVNVLRSVVHHLQVVKKLPLADLTNAELGDVIEPYARKIGRYFAAMTPEQMLQFRALRGVQGQTTATRRIEQAIKETDPTFDPPGLSEFLAREKAQTTTRAFHAIQHIEQMLQATVIGELKSEFGPEEQGWWFGGVPKSVRKKVDDRINEEGGKKGGREENFDLIDYREIVTANWPLFQESLARGKGSKGAKTKWLVEVNDIRKPVMHASKGTSLPISEEQLALLEELESWLDGQIAETEEAG